MGSRHFQARHNRRALLQGALAAALWLGVGASRARLALADQGQQSAPLSPELEQYLQPNPAKLARVAQDPTLAVWLAAFAASAPGIAYPDLPFASGTVIETDRWRIGNHPNYTCAAQCDGAGAVLVACYGSAAVYRVCAKRGQVHRLPTGSNTNPLDVAFDAARNRIIVASADPYARLIVLESTGERRSLSLINGTGQGQSNGGAQGVTIDGEGNYWAALAYYDPEITDRGVVIKIDAEALKPVLILRNQGMNNPNGIVASPDGSAIFVMSDDGKVQRFSLDGTLQNVYHSLGVGYRGTVYEDELWVCGWIPEGRMVRVDLETGRRAEFPCIPFANCIAVDRDGLVWVAGDAGVSVSTRQGKLLAASPVGAQANGLSILVGDAYFVTYDSWLRAARHGTRRSVLPVIQVGQPR